MLKPHHDHPPHDCGESLHLLNFDLHQSQDRTKKIMSLNGRNLSLATLTL